MNTKTIALKVKESIIVFASKKAGMNCWGYLYEPQKPKCLIKNKKERR